MNKLLSLFVLLFLFEGVRYTSSSSSEANEENYLNDAKEVNYLNDVVDLSPSFSSNFDEPNQVEEEEETAIDHTLSLESYGKYDKLQNAKWSRRKRSARKLAGRKSPSKPKSQPSRSASRSSSRGYSSSYAPSSSRGSGYYSSSHGFSKSPSSSFGYSRSTSSSYKFKSSSSKVSISPSRPSASPSSTWPSYGVGYGGGGYHQGGYAGGSYPGSYGGSYQPGGYPGFHQGGYSGGYYPGGYPGYYQKRSGWSFPMFIPIPIPIGYPGWHSHRSPPRISSDPSVPIADISINRLQIEENKRVQVTCSGNSHDITWEKDNVIDVAYGILHVTKETENNVNSSTLVFESTKLEHTGTYRCIVKIGKSSDTQKFALNVITSSDEKPNVTLVPSSEIVNLFVNQSYQAICKGNSPQISWIDKKEKVISQYGGSPNVIHQSNESALVFHQVKLDDKGHYTCVVDKNGYNITKSFVLEVTEFPKEVNTILFPDEDHVIKFESQAYNVICNGNTTDNISWRDPNNNPILPKLNEFDNKTIYTVVGQKRVSLYITDMKLSNIGHYTCSINDAPRDVTKSLFLDVKPLPRLKFIPDDDSIEIMKDEKYSVVCNGTNSTSNIMWFGPNDEIIFQKDSKINRRIYVTVGNNSVKLHFDKMLLQNEGNYSCFANVNGTSIRRSLSVSLNNYETLPKPHFTSDFDIIESKVILYLNETAEIICETERRDATVNWHGPSNYSVISSDLSQRIHMQKFSDQKKSLIINGVMYSDSGIYFCTSETYNKISNRTLHVSVIQRVHFLSDTQYVSEMAVMESKNVTLFCGATGEPTPRIVWYFQNKPIQVDSKYEILGNNLTVTNTSYLTAGKYTCKASQDIIGGTSAERAISLKVLHAPVFPAGSNVTIYRPLNGTNTIECSAVAEPAAIYDWYNHSEHLVVNSPVNYFKINLSKPSDLVTLNCSARNNLGSANQTLRLAEALQPPSIDVIKTTEHDIVYQIKTPMKTTISYKIEYYKDSDKDNTSLIYFEEFEKSGSSNEEHTIKNLEPGTKYVIRAASYNSEWTEFSKAKDIKTSDGAIATSAIVMIVISTIAVLALQ